ncbi:MAG TPA: CHAD domain-containing protein, partial [Vicinamibacterales bacterium]|nr:CHAD domain-containing protein [Vicinamibacterales bacterium]
VERRARPLLTALDRAGTVYAPSPLHDVRIAAKKFRYAVELVRELAGVPLAEPLRAMKAEQERLGQLHDLQVVQARLQALAGRAGTSRAAIRAFKTVTVALENDCRALHAEFVGGVAGFAESIGRARTASALALVQPAPRRMAGRPAKPSTGSGTRAGRGHG